MLPVWLEAKQWKSGNDTASVAVLDWAAAALVSRGALGHTLEANTECEEHELKLGEASGSNSTTEVRPCF